MIRLAVRAPADAAEQVLGALLEMAPSGIEQVDDGDIVEFAVYGPPGELPELAEGEADVAGVRVMVSGTEVPDDWEERWKQFHQPILVGDRLYVRPPWMPSVDRTSLSDPHTAIDSVADVVIDPGRAFGTGAHATTRLCLELLLEVEPIGSVTDLGCGSGVLAIAASKLGFEPVTAFDADRLAVEATLANAEANGVELANVDRVDLRHQLAPMAELTMANLMRPLLLRVAALMGRERPPRMILSGLLEEEAGEVAAAFAPLREGRQVSAQGWSALLLEG